MRERSAYMGAEIYLHFAKPQINFKHMKVFLLVLSLSFLFLYSCHSPMDLSNVQAEATLAPVDLKPAYDLQGLRIDVLRQFQDDGCGGTEAVAYHPMGFDLGNGLFMDLNNNLSLLPQDLLNIEEDENYQIKRIPTSRGFQRVTIKEQREGQVCDTRQYNSGSEWRRCREVNKTEDVIEITRRGTFCYRIKEENGGLKYSTRRNGGRWTSMEPTGGNSYLVTRGVRKIDYSREGQQINLGRRYMMRRNPDGKKLELYFVRKWQIRRLYTIEKSGDGIYAYNDQRFGRKVEVQPNKLVVYRNNLPQYDLEVIK